MARSRITTPTKDLISDGGSVLISLVQGEQRELPVVLDFVDVADTNYNYSAVLIEGLNDGEGTLPTEIQPSGDNTSLTVRLCPYVGDWNATAEYDREDVVDYGGQTYRLLTGTSRISSLIPSDDPLWELHDKRTVYIQFLSALSTTYTTQPTPSNPVYGFVELSVTEVADPLFNTTWKPVRGLVEFLFSPLLQ